VNKGKKMTDPLPVKSHFSLVNIPSFLIYPRQGVTKLASQSKSTWQMPLLVVSILFLVRIVVSGVLQVRASAAGQVTLPADWQWWTPDMQNNYMQAMQATQGPVFVYIIPALLGLTKLWLSWLILSGLLHLASTLLGGRGSMRSVLNLAAWACLPFALRDLLRVIFMLIAGHVIISPGLSGFSSVIFLNKLLAGVDLFFMWFGVLLGIGLCLTDNLPAGKSAAAVVIVLLLLLLVQGGLGAMSASLGGLMITRPFF
jgi:hypothetical protein